MGDAGDNRYAAKVMYRIVARFFAAPLLLLATPVFAATLAGGDMLVPVVKLERVTSNYGPRSGGFHPGLDLAAPYGSPVRAAAGGIVIYAGRYFDYGNMVDIRMRDGKVTRYAHLAKIAKRVRKGAVISEGGILGAVGTTGHAHGAHLHFEVRVYNKPVNPRLYLAFTAPTTPEPQNDEVAEAPEPRAKNNDPVIPPKPEQSAPR